MRFWDTSAVVSLCVTEPRSATAKSRRRGALAFISAATLAFVASGLALAIREEPMALRPSPASGIPVAGQT